MNILKRLILSTIVALCLLGAATPAAAASSELGGLRATVHGALGLRIEACLHSSDGTGALVLAFIENPGDAQAGPFRVTLHDTTGALLAERSYAGLLPGDSKAFAVRLGADAAAAWAGRSICDDGAR